jgi:hypothetical protein
MTEPLMRSNAETPIDRPCRYCGAEIGGPCTTVLKAGGEYVRVLHYFHQTRWNDYYKWHSERAAMDDWNKRYGGKTA